MNFRDYLEILQSEQLDESPLADGILIIAMETNDDEEKLTCIFNAVDLARMEKEDVAFRQIVHDEFERVNGYRHKGFMHEYKMMKEG